MSTQFRTIYCCVAVLLTLAPEPARAQPRDSSLRQSDPLPENSVWADEDESLTLTVTDRKGETFRGKLVSGETVERNVRGTVKNGKVAWLAKDVQAVKGGQGGDNTGTIIRDRIEFEYQSDAGNGRFTLRRRGAAESRIATSNDSRYVRDKLDESSARNPEPVFFLDIEISGMPPERIDALREALNRLDQLRNSKRSKPNFKATVKLFSDTKTYRSPQETRKGVETLILSSFDRASRQYGITIVATPVRSHISSGYLETTPPAKDDVLVFGLEAMRFLYGFKPKAIRQTGLKGIVLCEKYLLNDRPYVEGGGAMQDMLVLEIKNLPEGMAPNFYHELYHVFDLTTLAKKARVDADWQALNAPGFAYKGYGDFFGSDGKANRQAFTARAPDGFVNVYATSDIMEDKAVTYSAMMVSAEWLAEAIESDPRLNAKVELLERRLQLLGPEYTPGFWRPPAKAAGEVSSP